MSAIGRKCSVVNLDPANDQTSYPCALDVRDLVTLEDIMAQEELGPNGGTLYAIEELEHNFEWLENGLKKLGGGFCPGCGSLYPDLGKAVFRGDFRRFPDEAGNGDRGLRSFRLSRPSRDFHPSFVASKYLLSNTETRV